MHELAFGITNNNAVTGAARNPWDPSMIPGGSSGGTAVAVAARMMPAGIGTDTGGSVRIPAALCGLAGFRPSVGRYSGRRDHPHLPHPRHGGPDRAHRRRPPAPRRGDGGHPARESAVGIGAGAGRAESDPAPTPALAGLRLGVPRAAFYRDLEPDVAAEADRVLDLLSDLGVALVEAEVPDVMDLNAAVGFPVALYEFVRDLPRYLAEKRARALDEMTCSTASEVPTCKAIVASQLGAEAMPEAVYRQALDVDRPRLQRTYADYFAEHAVEAVLFPTSPVSARPIGDDETIDLGGERVPTFPTFIRNTDPGSNAGIPGISLPTGLASTGLPIGMELDGPAGSDERLLAVAAAVEEAVGFDARPDGA